MAGRSIAASEAGGELGRQASELRARRVVSCKSPLSCLERMPSLPKNSRITARMDQQRACGGWPIVRCCLLYWNRQATKCKARATPTPMTQSRAVPPSRVWRIRRMRHLCLVPWTWRCLECPESWTPVGQAYTVLSPYRQPPFMRRIREPPHRIRKSKRREAHPGRYGTASALGVVLPRNRRI